MGYDELARIERVYGSVAEYNRCQMEEQEQYEPTEEEIEESEREMEAYYAEIERLNGTPSNFIRKLVAEWDAKEPANDDYYAVMKWGKERKLDIVAKVAEHYGVTVDEEWATFYRVPENRFAIAVEYKDFCYIKSKHIGNLTLEQFKDIFRDLYYAKLYPTMSHNGRYVSNCSLGNILRNDLRNEL